MAQLREFTYPSSDGVHAIHAQEWVPQVPLRGVVQIVHGVAEHMGRYEGAAAFLAEHGYLVCGEDHLGHGKTVEDGSYGFFAPKDGWDLVVRDVRRLRELEGEKYPSLPYFLLGHSMGSFLTRTYLIQYPGTLDGVILSGTGQESAPLVALGKALASLECRRLGSQGVSPLVDALSLGAYNRRFRPNRTGADWISSDPAAVDAYLADPLCRPKPTVHVPGHDGGTAVHRQGGESAEYEGGHPGALSLRGTGPGGRHGPRGAEGPADVPGRGLHRRDPEALPRRPPRDVPRGQPAGGL